MENKSGIPKKIHQIWIGDKSIPPHCVNFSNDMRRLHPDWEYKLWSHHEIFNVVYKDDPFLQSYLKDPELYRWAFIADRVRLLILRDYGGVYCDLDARPIRPFDTVLNKLSSQHTFFAGMKPSQDNNTLIDCTVYGAVKGSRVVEDCLSCYESLTWAHGCKTFNNKIIQTMDTDIALLSYEYFYDNKITDKTIVLHDVEETRLFSWVDDEKLKKSW